MDRFRHGVRHSGLHDLRFRQRRAVFTNAEPSTPRQRTRLIVSSAIAGNSYGSLVTPADNITGVAGAIPVTGWALDNVEVTKVDVWREHVGSEPAGPLIYIGDAVFVD